MRLKQLLTRKPANPSRAVAAAAVSALALGATAIGAVAIGVLTVGRLLIGRLAIKGAHFRTLEIDELTVRRLHVTDEKEPELKSTSDHIA